MTAKHQPMPGPAMSAPPSGRAEHPGRRHQRAVEADGVRDVDVGDQVGDEGPAGGVLEGGDRARREGEEVHGPERLVAGEHEHGEGGGHDRADGVHRDEQVVAVAPVGEDAAPGAEHEDREELGGGDQADGDAAVGDGQHEQADGDHLHPGAGLADDLADEEQAEVAAAQRAEGVGAEGADAGHRARSSGGEVLEHVGGGGEPLELVGAGGPGAGGPATPSCGPGCARGGPRRRR